MKETPRLPVAGRLAALTCGLAIFAGGCGGEEGGTSPEVAKAQQETSAAWAKEKAEHKNSSRTTGKAENRPASGSRGFINKPGI